MKPILILSLVLFGSALSAKDISISGRVTDERQKGLGGVAVLLLNGPDSSIARTGISDANGHFSFEAASQKMYIVRAVALPGEASYSAPFTTTEQDVALPDLVMSTSAKNLDEVSVRGQKPLIEVHADKIVMNVESSIISTGSTALEVLQRAPGVAVDQNDNISLKGRQGVTIMMDGKILPLSGTDLANVLKGMPSASIDKIEIISNPGARYDAAGTAGIINIRTKKDKRMGANGSITAGYGQGIYPKENAGINLNYRNKKLAMYGSYNFSKREGINNLGLLRHFYTNGQLSSAYDQENDMLIHMHSHGATVGADYSLSQKTTIGTVLTGGLNGFNLTGNSKAIVMDSAEVPNSYFNTVRENTNSWDNWGVNLNMRHQIDSSGSDISVDLDYARYNNSSEQTLNTIYRFIDGSQQYPNYKLYGIADGYTDIRSLKADYSKPLSKTMKLDAGIKSSLVNADNNPSFYDQSNGGNVFDPQKSDHFIYDENINAAYVNTSKDWTKWSMQAGLRAEQTIAHGHQLVNDDRFDMNYTQLFPSLALTRHLDTKNDLGITLSRRIERPNYQQLNPFRRYLDVSSVNEGNPYLLPALTWAAELSHTWNGKFITQFSWSRTTNVITQVIEPEAGQITIVTDKNLATNTMYNFSGTYPTQITKWWNSTNGFSVWYTQYEGDLANTQLNDGSTAFYLSTQNSFTLPHDWSGELSAWYQSEQLYGYMHVQPQHAVGVGLQRLLLERKLVVKLSVTDIFLKENPNGRSDFSSYHEDFTVLRDSRVATLTLTYKFGKRSLAPTHRRQRGAEEELRRAATSAG